VLLPSTTSPSLSKLENDRTQDLRLQCRSTAAALPLQSGPVRHMAWCKHGRHYVLEKWKRLMAEINWHMHWYLETQWAHAHYTVMIVVYRARTVGLCHCC
jgi:hypothetical protein